MVVWKLYVLQFFCLLSIDLYNSFSVTGQLFEHIFCTSQIMSDAQHSAVHELRCRWSYYVDTIAQCRTPFNRTLFISHATGVLRQADASLCRRLPICRPQSAAITSHTELAWHEMPTTSDRHDCRTFQGRARRTNYDGFIYIYYTTTLYSARISAIYLLPFSKVWLGSVCWPPCATPGNEYFDGKIYSVHVCAQMQLNCSYLDIPKTLIKYRVRKLSGRPQAWTHWQPEHMIPSATF